ncbi:MAG: DUF4369 domain-containing protein [Prevotellaceae bacterium]|nr:DUF4369 domain-containing protein [Prevotellaceae bacterium]
MIRPLHILYIIVVALLMVSCGPSGPSFRIRGSFRDMQVGELYIYNLSSDNARIDTMTVQGGKFQYKGQAEEVTPYILVFPNGMEQVIFVGPGEDLEYEATANDLKNYVVNGSAENKLMNQFRQETYPIDQSLVRNVAKNYIREHADSPVAIYLLDRYFLQDNRTDSKELQELFKVVKEKRPRDRMLLALERDIAYPQQLHKGQQLPDVTLVNKDKSSVKLWKESKDYNLIVFWSTWMPNGYDVLWRMRRSNKDYKEDGRLRTVGISLDIERYRWEDAVRQDSIDMEHYCDGLAFESDVVKRLGISSLPYYIITDKDHKIIGTSNDIKELDSDLKKYIK